MNKNQFKNAFDTFNPTKEQKQKMFDNIKKTANQKTVLEFKKIYVPLSYGVAALFVVAAGFGIIKNNTDILNIVHYSNSENQSEITLLLNNKPPMAMVRTVEPTALVSDAKAINESIHTLTKISPKIPEDMTLTSESDDMNMTYTGSGTRCVNITVEYKSEKNKKYIEDEYYKKTNIMGYDAVVFYDGIYNVYMDVEDISYEITGVEITENELKDILISLT